MKLIRIDEFAERYFDESCRPDPRTVRYWCENGHLPARRIGKPWYVDVDKFEQTHDAPALIKKLLIRLARLPRSMSPRSPTLCLLYKQQLMIRYYLYLNLQTHQRRRLTIQPAIPHEIALLRRSLALDPYQGPARILQDTLPVRAADTGPHRPQ